MRHVPTLVKNSIVKPTTKSGWGGRFRCRGGVVFAAQLMQIDRAERSVKSAITCFGPLPSTSSSTPSHCRSMDDAVSPPSGARPTSDSMSSEAQSAEHDAASALSLRAAQPRAPAAHATRPSSSDSSSPEAQSESTEHDAAPVAHVVVTAASVRASIETDAPRATRPTGPPHLVFPLASSIEIPQPQQAHRVVEVVDARAAHHPRRSRRIAAADGEVSDAP